MEFSLLKIRLDVERLYYYIFETACVLLITYSYAYNYYYEQFITTLLIAELQEMLLLYVLLLASENQMSRVFFFFWNNSYYSNKNVSRGGTGTSRNSIFEMRFFFSLSSFHFLCIDT